MEENKNDPLVLEMVNITKRFAGVTALDNVNLTLSKGEVLILVGENGAGKSTLMKILAGAYQKDGGQVLLHGRETSILSPHHANRLGISIIFQEMALFPDLTATENIFIGREVSRSANKSLALLNRAIMKERARSLLGEFDSRIDPSTPVRNLRVGQKQVVEIARALNDNASILVLDEPTAALEDAERELLFRHIQTLRQSGVSIIYVSHRLQECMEIGDRIMVLRDGRNVADIPVASTTVDQVVEMMVGHSLKEFFPKKEVLVGDELLRVDRLSASRKFRDVSFTLRRGEILGLAGLPDSGKSDLSRAISGVEPYQDGEIFLSGKAVKADSPGNATQAGIAFLPADRKSEGLFLDHSVRVNITIANLREITRGLLDLGQERQVAARYTRDLKIKTPSLDQPTRNLSGGNQQKVMLARWLYTKPEVLILEEPTRGIDVGAKVEVFELITQFVQNGGGVVMVSSELPELAGMCDRTLVMHEGVVVAELDRAETTEQRLAQYQVKKAQGVRNGNS